MDPFTMDLLALVQAIQDKNIGVEELTKAYLSRIESYDGKDGLNTICELNPDALSLAKEMDNRSDRSGALFGMPIWVKDNIDVHGLRTTAGSLALTDNIATRDAGIIQNLRKNGAIILGKTNMTEFANYVSPDMPSGYSSRSGQVLHAYNKQSDPSGSSTGSAVAVSAGFCAAAIGTDTSFSIVGCACVNGVTGYKPPHGSLPSDGIIPIAKTLDSAGPIAKDLSSAILTYSCMRNTPLEPIRPLAANTMRLAVNSYNQDDVSDAQMSKYLSILDAFRADGGKVDTVHHPYTPYQRDIMRCEFKEDLEEYLSSAAAGVYTLSEVIRFYENNPSCMKYGISYLSDALGSSRSDASYALALEKRKELRAEILHSLKSYDACLFTGPTNIMHFTGLPSLALRLGMGEDGLPRGMILYGSDERRLLAAALTLERYCKPIVQPRMF